MRDYTSLAHDRLQQAVHTLQSYLGSHRYSEIDTPLLEETELFVRKSGGELTSRLYTFTDPGGHRVSLRPEFTSSVIRHYLQECDAIALPARWQYAGPVFRYEPGENAGYRQFTQLGAEMVGALGIDADAEIISLARGGLEKIGLRGVRLIIGHIGALHDILDAFSLSDAAKVFIIGNVHDIKSGGADAAELIERAADVGLLRDSVDLGVGVSLEKLSEESTQAVIEGILRDSMPAQVGRRTPEQVVQRLLKKMSASDERVNFEKGLNIIAKLVYLSGPSQEVLNDASRIVSDAGMRSVFLEEFAKLFDALHARGVPSEAVTLDLGLARGISYYTGVRFELAQPVDGGEVLLGGGGRYDGLVKALGGDVDVPALGFAYNLDEVIDALDNAGSAQTSAESVETS